MLRKLHKFTRTVSKLAIFIILILMLVIAWRIKSDDNSEENLEPILYPYTTPPSKINATFLNQRPSKKELFRHKWQEALRRKNENFETYLEDQKNLKGF